MNPHVLGLRVLATIQCGGGQANTFRIAEMVTSSVCFAGTPPRGGASRGREVPGFVGGMLMGWFKGCWVYGNRKVFLK